MRQIGLMGGSFNPIHCGHLNMGRAALDSGVVEQVLFLPSGNPPHKRAGLEDKLHRLAMARLAVAGEKSMDVCTEEIDREGVIYTVDTLTILREKMPGCRFHYLIGADTLRALHTWRRPEDVIRLCALLVVMRPGEDEAKTHAVAQQWRARGAQISFLAAQPMDISSTGIRSRLEHGLSLAGLVPEPVEAYIREQGLYETHGDRA
ncbi:MAG: nicotinate (nicotinamide) nucleotide adenylyltransferase [Clostridiales bacterium]|nr:nicotinate (nicotinamide) nucleotide adenylyltransferase [Clostridiales bacterium]